MLLSELCVDLQEQVCSYLSTRDLLSLSSCCWPEVGSSVLRARERAGMGSDRELMGCCCVCVGCHAPDDGVVVLQRWQPWLTLFRYLGT